MCALLQKSPTLSPTNCASTTTTYVMSAALRQARVATIAESSVSCCERSSPVAPSPWQRYVRSMAFAARQEMETLCNGYHAPHVPEEFQIGAI